MVFKIWLLHKTYKSNLESHSKLLHRAKPKSNKTHHRDFLHPLLSFNHDEHLFIHLFWREQDPKSLPSWNTSRHYFHSKIPSRFFAKSHVPLPNHFSSTTPPHYLANLVWPNSSLPHYLYHPHGNTVPRIWYVVFVVCFSTILLPYLVSYFYIKIISCRTWQSPFTSLKNPAMVCIH